MKRDLAEVGGDWSERGGEMVGGDGSEMGSVMKKGNKNRRPISMPASPRTSGIKRRATIYRCRWVMSPQFFLVG